MPYPSQLILFIILPTLEATDSFIKFLTHTPPRTRICSKGSVAAFNVRMYVRYRNLCVTCLATVLDCQNIIHHTVARYVQLYD